MIPEDKKKSVKSKNEQLSRKKTDFIKEYISYITNNLFLIIKGIVYSILLVMGPVGAVLVRRSGGNVGTIIAWGIILEAVGMILFSVLINKDINPSSKQEEDEKEERDPSKL